MQHAHIAKLTHCCCLPAVSSYRDDCKTLAHFVHRVESFLMETEDEADMSGPGWQAAFSVRTLL
jgi:hypothetical protein